MKTFIIKANVVRAAQVFQGKNDPRYYLNGVFIGKDGTVAGTNGHAAFISNHDTDIDQDYILDIQGTVPKSAHILELTLVDKKVIIECINSSKKTVKLICGTIIDGKYPNINKVIPDYSDEVMNKMKGVNQISLQARYVAMTEKVFGSKHFSGVILKFSDDPTKVMVIESGNANHYPKNTKVLIMPVRSQ